MGRNAYFLHLGFGRKRHIFLAHFVEKNKLSQNRGRAMPDPGAEANGGTAPSILLVDDDEAFSYAANRYLQSVGYRVTTVLNGTLALEVLDSATFDVLVLDCVMPPGIVRGASLGRMVRYRNPRQKMVFITAHPDIVEIEGELPGPILFKPIQLHDLHTAISKYSPGTRNSR